MLLESAASAPARERLLTVAEAADLLGVSRWTLLIRLKDEPALGFKLFGRWRVRAAAVDALLTGKQLDRSTPGVA